MEQDVQGRRSAAWAASATAAALALVLVLRDGPSKPDFSDPLQYVQDGLFLAYLVAASLALVLAARAGLVARTAARLIALGYGLLVIGVSAGMALREDPEWFAAIGGPGNLLAGIGFVVLTVAAVRRRTMPVPLAVFGGIAGFFAVLFSELGSGVLVAVFFACLALTAPRSAQQGDADAPRPVLA